MGSNLDKKRPHSQAGLNHILKHADEFATKGINQSQLPEFITNAVSKGEIVGYQGKGKSKLSNVYKVENKVNL